MIERFVDYFQPEHEISLENIEYNRSIPTIQKQAHQMTCTDKLSVKLDLENNGIGLLLTRSMAFEPQDLFELSVSFSALLTIKEDRKNEIDWEKINLAEEFRNNGNFILDGLFNRITLLIGQITASYGQTPIMLYPQFAPTSEK